MGIGTKKFNRTDKKKVPLGKSYTKPVDEELPYLNLEDLEEEEEVVARVID